MTSSEVSNSVKNLILANDFESAFSILLTETKSKKYINSVISVQSRHERLTDESIQGVLSSEEKQIRIANIQQAVLELCDRLDRILHNRIKTRTDGDIDQEMYNVSNIMDLLQLRKYSKNVILNFFDDNNKVSAFKSTEYSSSDNKKIFVVKALNFCSQNDAIEELLEWAEVISPDLYEEYGPYIIQESSSAILPSDSLSKSLRSLKISLPEEENPIIVISGKIGNGKSTTINTLFGRKVTQTGHSKRGTVEDGEFHWKYKDENLELVDVPGLGDFPERDKEYRKIYKKWARKANGFIIVISPPRPAEFGTIETIRTFLESGVPSQNLIFGLNKLSYLNYENLDGGIHTVRLNGLKGIVGSSGRMAVENLKLSFLTELQQHFTNHRFRIEQIVEFDALSGWNIYRLLNNVVSILPFQAILKFREATEQARNELQKKIKDESDREYLQRQEEDFAQNITEKIFDGVENLVSKVSKKMGDKFRSNRRKNEKKFKKIISSGRQVVKSASNLAKDVWKFFTG